MGDSITAFWWLPSVNLGVPGNSTAAMLARFPSEVLGHGYKAVVILGGTNDTRNSQTPIVQIVKTAVDNIEAMAQLAEKENMEVVLCHIPPERGLDSKVIALNSAIDILAQAHNYKLVDYYTPMADHPEYFPDGVHPDHEGYWVMQSALEKVIPLDY